MIVVDTNVLAYLLVPGKYTASAETLLATDSGLGCASLVAQRVEERPCDVRQSKLLEIADAAALHRRAAELIGSEEYDVETLEVLRLSKSSGCSGYGCEFVALADFLDVRLVTTDAKLVKAFPRRAALLPS